MSWDLVHILLNQNMILGNRLKLHGLRSKSSWRELVGKGGNTAFSASLKLPNCQITQILPGITFPDSTTMEPMMHTAISNDCKHDVVDKSTINGAVIDLDNNTIPENEHAGGYDIASAPVIMKKIETSSSEKSTEDVEIGKTCSFMRSAASLKEWAKS